MKDQSTRNQKTRRLVDEKNTNSGKSVMSLSTKSAIMITCFALSRLSSSGSLSSRPSQTHQHNLCPNTHSFWVSLDEYPLDEHIPHGETTSTALSDTVHVIIVDTRTHEEQPGSKSNEDLKHDVTGLESGSDSELGMSMPNSHTESRSRSSWGAASAVSIAAIGLAMALN